MSMMKLSSAECRLVADITDVTIDVGEDEENEVPDSKEKNCPCAWGNIF